MHGQIPVGEKTLAGHCDGVGSDWSGGWSRFRFRTRRSGGQCQELQAWDIAMTGTVPSCLRQAGTGSHDGRYFQGSRGGIIGPAVALKRDAA